MTKYTVRNRRKPIEIVKGGREGGLSPSTIFVILRLVFCGFLREPNRMRRTKSGGNDSDEQYL